MDTKFEINYGGICFIATRTSYSWCIKSPNENTSVITPQEIQRHFETYSTSCHLRSALDGRNHVLYRGRFQVGDFSSTDPVLARVQGATPIAAAELFYIHKRVETIFQCLEIESKGAPRHSNLMKCEELQYLISESYDFGVAENECLSVWQELPFTLESELGEAEEWELL